MSISIITIRAQGAYRLLLLDGHTSHFNWLFFDMCLEKRIIPFCLPAHSTHLLQPLDVGLFSPLQRHYSNELDKWFRKNQGSFTKGDFLPFVTPPPPPSRFIFYIKDLIHFY